MDHIEEVFLRSFSPLSFARGYLDYLQEIFKKLEMKQIQQLIEILMAARSRESTIFFIGNGGSASTASHFANDISLGTRAIKPPFRAISLCDNVSILSAIGNDFGYDQVFVKQLEVLMKKDDVVVVISASGNSPNIIKAVEYANQNKGITFGLIGFNGGKVAKLTKYQIHVPSCNGEYGPVEDTHMVIDHLVSSYIRLSLMEDICIDAISEKIE